MDSNFITSKVEKIENGIQHQGLPLKISERLVVAFSDITFSKLDGNNRFRSGIWCNGSFGWIKRLFLQRSRGKGHFNGLD